MDVEKEQQLNETYQKFIRASLYDLPLEALGDSIDQGLMGYGTTEDERINNLYDYLELIKRQRAQAKDAKDVAVEEIPIHRKISDNENTALIVEEFNISMRLPQGTHSLHLRVTTILEYKKNQWVAIHFHSSLPEKASSKEDTWNINEWKREKEKLQKLVVEKTSDLESKNRELEIEAALERVRARTMGMHSSEELNELISKVFDELTQLDLILTRGIFLIWEPDQKSVRWWMANSETPSEPMNFLIPHHEHPTQKAYIKAWKRKDQRWTYELKGKVKRDWDYYLFSETELSMLPPSVIKGMKAPDKVILTASFYDFGCLSVASLEPLSENHIQLIIRFAKVFDQTYTRFLDLQKAETQAREAQIEAALERVRARSLAMHHSDELQQVVGEVFNQLNALKLKMDAVQIEEIQKDPQGMHVWVANENLPYGRRFRILHLGYKLLKEYIQARDSGKEEFYGSMSKESKDNYYKKAFEKTELKDIPDARKKQMFAGDGIGIYAAIKRYTAIQLLNFERNVYTPLERRIVQRFAAVFEQAFTRLLDLLKAEAQAREAEIEVALERMRAQMLAMHNSNDIEKACIVMYEQLNTLGVVPESAAVYIAIIDHKTDTAIQWLVSDKTLIQPFDEERTPLTEHKLLIETYKGWKQRDPVLIRDLSGKKLQEFADYLQSLPWQQGSKFNSEKLPDRLIWTEATFSHGTVGFIHTSPLPEADINILIRFSRVFDLTYQRFFDLQKAETQAREAQIEAALERVRSASMAMHESKDVHKIANVVLQEMDGLEMSMSSVIIQEFRNDSKDMYFWAAAPGMEYPEIVHFPYIKSQYFSRFNQAREKSETFFSDQITKRETHSNWRHYFKYNQVPEERQKFLLSMPGMARSCALFKNTAISILQYDATPFSEDENKVLIRFGQVFQQSYQRFLDLKKAEAQAREAQIEASLERVRSKAMAMHSSKGLTETVHQLFKEFDGLKIDLLRCGVARVYESRQVDLFTFNRNEEGIAVPVLGKAHLSGHPVLDGSFKGWQDGIEYHGTIEGESLKAYYKAVTANFDLPVTYENVKHYGYWFYFPEGCLYTFTKNPLSLEELDIYRKFNAVVGLTYRRYIDLQKAEDQAREAQIEAALERLRSRSLAMQESTELREVVQVLYTQLQGLNLSFDLCDIQLRLDDSKDADCWTGTGDEVYKEMIHWPQTNIPILDLIYNAWDSGKVLDLSYGPSETLKFLQGIIKTGVVPESRQKFLLKINKMQYIGSFQHHTGVDLIRYDSNPFSQADKDIVSRFSKAFEQSYVRFLDLQKAEAQAREAQIETALERVRSRSMAMHKSDELTEVIATVFQQLKNLNFDVHATALVLIDEDGAQVTWLSGFSKEILPKSYRIPPNDHPYFTHFIEMWKSRIPYDQFVFEGELKKSYDNYIFEETEFKHAPKDVQEAMRADTEMILSAAYMKYGWIEIDTNDPISEEKSRILQRFAKVFEQTYTRFLDLQKAEAQARKAQIEAALERVRSRTMAMHDSSELGDVVTKLFETMRSLGFEPTVCNIALVDRETLDTDIWTAHVTDQGVLTYHLLITHFHHPFREGLLNAYINKIPISNHTLLRKFRKSYIKQFTQNGDFSQVPDAVLKANMELKDSDAEVVLSAAYMKYGILIISRSLVISNEESIILQRFAKVFEQTYTRFLDLQKAEDQAREAQIEAALERVRARTMAMQHSDELPEAANLLFLQIQSLGINAWSAGYNILEEDKKASNCVMSSEGVMQTAFRLPFTKEKSFWKWYKAIISKDDFFVQELGGKDLEEHYDYLVKLPGVQDSIDPLEETGISLPSYQINHLSFFKHGFLLFITYEKVPEAHDIFKRFTQVFDQTYARFLDLQKAEAQAREAQIEASLEKVRAKAMAMHSTKDISDATAIVFNELTRLGVEMVRCGIGILHGTSSQLEIWSTPISPKDKKVKEVITGYVESNSHPMIQSIFEAWRNNESYFEYTLHASEVRDYYEKLGKLPGYQFPKIAKYPDRQMAHCFYFEHGNIFVYSEDDLSEEQKQLLHRFANVFSLTYKRYLDLKNAEAQAREAHIEAALERVRSKAMAMHNSSDLPTTASIVFTELRKLGIKTMRSGISIQNRENRKILLYTGTDLKDGNKLSLVGSAVLDNHPVLTEIYDRWIRGEDYFPVLKGELLKSYYEQIAPNFTVPKEQSEVEQYGYFISYSNGIFYGWAKQPFAEDKKKILNRFASVVDLTFKRYFDLQRAEQNAREAQIEAALERVRSKAMAMQQSEDLSLSVATTLDELEKLELQIQRCGVGIFDKENKKVQLWTTTHTDSEKQAAILGELPLMTHPMMKNSYKAWLKKEGYSHVLEGDDLRAYYDMLLEEGFALPADNIEKAISIERQYYKYFTFPAGGLYVFSEEKLSDEAGGIIQRFADVFHLAFTRYLDLQNAEKRAVEAVKQASLDRVRAEIASMRSPKDLERITPLIWKELTALGVPFFRCGIFIINEEEEMVHVYLSTPSGQSLAALHIRFDENEISMIQPSIDNWRKQEVYREEWDQQRFVYNMNLFMKRGHIKSQKKYQAGDAPPEKLVLQLVPFKQGMLYVGNTDPLEKDEIALVQSLAEAFSIAYARYEDFTQLENALGELQSTQAQLIHSEKMASLGELTAGIAHEIQNPLNFVNNFSEVSADLIEELKEGLAEGNNEEVKEISQDLLQNLEKINHHGQRASSIVKGMLEHSRTGTQTKELTDLNLLADEYLRLAYHGLRAKDKSFNANFKTDLESTLPKVKVYAQDIGRVLLNMVNNAFYAVSSKLQESKHDDFKPEVKISTRQNGKNIQMVIQDNGNGIPQKHIDKIFQPFFTTKPTGEGTGLGLSLSYDIITQGHNGHLEVESQEGLGARFIIELPLTT